ncbi:hypothetical protein DM01DRAFT_1133506 [Hesseltinella vesiculosa]|uniref:Uncharacterized protein n=1 Tax=Hesseltinella vesiculosa TaxID=101127 RepID=A0A1X2G8S4_9FUNG|nr:hypothetical protein DM01DRAFT_1133506 [Hesseltinella vesiculosa]
MHLKWLSRFARQNTVFAQKKQTLIRAGHHFFLSNQIINVLFERLKKTKSEVKTAPGCIASPFRFKMYGARRDVVYFSCFSCLIFADLLLSAFFWLFFSFLFFSILQQQLHS